MNPPDLTKTLIRPMAIVARTGMSEQTVRRRIADGTLESIRVGRSVYVTVESVEALFSDTK